MYRIYADGRLIYDSALEDYNISKGVITKETDKSGSFVFALRPGHHYYDRLTQMKTVIKVTKGGAVVFRGRVLDDVVDYWRQKTLTCEGELGFLRDSIIRPFDFSGTPEELFRKLIAEHNAQVDEVKQFHIGTCTVEDPNGYVARENSAYETTLSNLQGRLLNSKSGGHLYITHDDEDDLPTIHYLADYPNTASQAIEFGLNLRNYTRKMSSADICTAVIPLGAAVDDGNSDTEDPKLTIASVNDGKDYVYSEAGVALYGWIYKTVEWDDVTVASNLMAKAQEYVDAAASAVISVELTAVDMHLLDRSIESYNLGDYVRITSAPHGFSALLPCTKQTMDLLQPANDTVTLGHTYAGFTATAGAGTGGGGVSPVVLQLVQSKVSTVTRQLVETSETVTELMERIALLENSNGLPSGYTALSYIQTSGTQYIDTGFAPNQDTRVVMDLESVASHGDVPLFGARVAYKNTAFSMWLRDTSIQTDYNALSSVISLTTTQTRFVVDKNRNVTTAAGVSTTQTAATFQSAYTAYLFGLNQAGTLNSSSTVSVKLYGCQMYDADTLVRDFVPCVDSAGVYGLFDKVNRKFYTNAGTGAFTGGV